MFLNEQRVHPLRWAVRLTDAPKRVFDRVLPDPRAPMTRIGRSRRDDHFAAGLRQRRRDRLPQALRTTRRRPLPELVHEDEVRPQPPGTMLVGGARLQRGARRAHDDLPGLDLEDVAERLAAAADDAGEHIEQQRTLIAVTRKAVGARTGRSVEQHLDRGHAAVARLAPASRSSPPVVRLRRGRIEDGLHVHTLLRRRYVAEPLPVFQGEERQDPELAHRLSS